jgi:hypothetical protein
MELNEILQAISSVGFPIAACVYMMVVNNKTIKENTAATNTMVELMKNVLAHLNGGASNHE